MGRQSTTMRICIFLLVSLLSPGPSAPTETDRLPQFLQALPFFSQLQDLRQSFQDLQANIPAEVMAQITQNLPPFLANLLAAEQQQPAGRGLQDVVQQLQQFLPPFLANLLATQLTNGGSSQLLQQLQTVLSPEVFQQLQQIIANLQQTVQQPAAGRAGSTGTVPLSNTNGGFVFAGRSALDRGDDKYDDIETTRRWGGKFGGGGKYGWGKRPFNNYNSQKPSYGNYQNPYFGYYSQPSFGYPYYTYNPSGIPNQLPNIGIIGNNGVVVPATGTGTTTPTAIRNQNE